MACVLEFEGDKLAIELSDRSVADRDDDVPHVACVRVEVACGVTDNDTDNDAATDRDEESVADAEAAADVEALADGTTAVALLVSEKEPLRYVIIIMVKELPDPSQSSPD